MKSHARVITRILIGLLMASMLAVVGAGTAQAITRQTKRPGTRRTSSSLGAGPQRNRHLRSAAASSQDRLGGEPARRWLIRGRWGRRQKGTHRRAGRHRRTGLLFLKC